MSAVAYYVIASYIVTGTALLCYVYFCGEKALKDENMNVGMSMAFLFSPLMPVFIGTLFVLFLPSVIAEQVAKLGEARIEKKRHRQERRNAYPVYSFDKESATKPEFGYREHACETCGKPKAV